MKQVVLMKLHRKRPGPRGFALVVCVSLMVLMTLLAVGMLSLSGLALRQSGQNHASAAARANARLGLMLALGDLQKLAGPDRRVTADASILDVPPGNRHWVGVWRTDGYKTDDPGDTFLRVSRDGRGVSDRRASNSGYSVENESLGWLVSGSPASPKAGLPADQSVEMRSGKSPIMAPLVRVMGDGRGAHAYHISDESMKAKISLADPYAPATPDPADPAGGGMRRWIAPQAPDSSVFFKGSPVSPAESAKLVSRQQLALSGVVGDLPPGGLQALIREQGEEFTVHGLSLLADPVGGGLKKDLTAYLEDNRAPTVGPMTGITDATVISAGDARNRSRWGPAFGMLRNWYALRNEITRSEGKFSIRSQIPNAITQGSVNLVDPGDGFVKPLIQPVLAEASYYVNHVIDGPPSASRLVELLYPRVVLWNPFSIRLRTGGHVVLFEFRRSHSMVCRYRDVTGNTLAQTISYNSHAQPSMMPGFHIPPTEMEPGEALVFCAPAKGLPYQTNLVANTLSAAVSPANLGFFVRELPNNTLAASQPINQSTMEINHTFNGNVYWNSAKENGRTQTITLNALVSSSAVSAPDLLTGRGPVAVRQISLDNFSRGNNGRWLPQYTKTNIRRLGEVTDGNIPPDHLLAQGGRFRFIYESFSNRVHGQPFNEPWYFAPLEHYNIHAPNIHRWPQDNIFGLQYGAVSGTGTFGPHLYAYGHIAQARQWPPWLDSEVTPRRGPNGNYRTAVFSDASFAASGSVYPVSDLPLPGLPLTSLGALQHVPLSPFAWHPSRVIGNSRPTPFLPLVNASSHSQSDEANLWAGKTATLRANDDITGFHRVVRLNLLNDLSYEVNLALWDRYFLSAIPRAGDGWNGDEWDLATPFPNSRIRINPATASATKKSELLDFHRAATALWLDGGFNVHSTHVAAWKSLLRSFRDVPPPGVSGAAPGSSFPGINVPLGDASAVALDASRDRFWRDYRQLSDAEIDALAEAIVTQVRNRAPFLGLSDFVNRRLMVGTNPSRAVNAFGGVIQAALDQVTGINDNGSRNNDLRLPEATQAAGFTYGADYWGGPIATPEPQNYAVFHTVPRGPQLQKGSAAASQITQADILQRIAPVLVARGDTFVIRAYGEAHDTAGKPIARAWCEAVVQRTPTPITPDPATGGIDPLATKQAIDWGRKFEMVSFRWLAPQEI
jgi:hypothetical protein